MSKESDQLKRLLAIAVSAILLLQVVPVAWAFMIERPSFDIDIKKRTQESSTNGEASVGLGVVVDDYDYDSEYGGADCVTLNVSMAANARKGLTYGYDIFEGLFMWMEEGWLENKVVFTNVGDDWGTWVDLPGLFCFLFYGGRYREEDCCKIWICSNGFLSFDPSNSTSSNGCGNYVYPSTAHPNALMAALWTDLVIDDQAQIIAGRSWYIGDDRFVVIWKNARHKASGIRLTFAIALTAYHRIDEGQPYVEQGRIYVAYQSVSSISTNFFYGIEDQEGRKSTGKRETGSALGSLNEKTIIFYQNVESRFIKHTILEFEDSNYQHSRYNIRNEFPDFIRGNNLRTKTDPPREPDETAMFAAALGGTATFLAAFGGYLLDISVFPYIWPVSLALVTYSWLNWYAYAQYKTIEWLELKDDGTDPEIQCAYIKVPASSAVVEDAALCIVFHWILDTAYTQTHELTIRATNVYYGYPSYVENSVTTSVKIKIEPDNNNSFNTAYAISTGTYGLDPMFWLGDYDLEDYYKISVSSGHTLTVTMTPQSPADFDLYLYNPSKVLKAKKETRGNVAESITYQTDSSGYWFIKVTEVAGAGFGFYTLKVEVHSDSGGGGGGCPFVSFWDGTHYVLGNNLLPASEMSNGADVQDYYRLEHAPVRNDGKYSFLISEFEQEHSYIDQVKLIAVDHSFDIDIALTSEGEILTYKNPIVPKQCIDNYGGDRLSEICLMDGNVSDPATYFYGKPGDYLILDFGQVNSQNAKLILRDDMLKKDECVVVQVLDKNGDWQTVTTVLPRAYWSIQAANLSPYIVEGENLMVRLFWKSPHRLDFVGLDTTKQDEYEIHHANLVSASHSSQGTVKALLVESDNLYAELVPRQQIQLVFTLSNNSKEARTFIFYTEGHYYTITQ